MRALYTHNFIRIGITSLFLVAMVFGAFGACVGSVHAQGPPVTTVSPAAKQVGEAPATSDIAFTTKLGQFIGNFMLYIASQVTHMGGMLLEYSIEKFILHLSDFLKEGMGFTIEAIWRVIRDIANLAFIFGFIYIGIMTIIDSSSAQTKRMLASIIIGALLINFSLFFTRIIIDVSNYIAVEVYNTLISGTGSISQKFANALGVVTLFKPFSDPSKLPNLTTGGNVSFYFMGAIFLIVAGFTLAAGAVLLIIRFVTLVFIMVFSPLLFAATVFPQTQSIANDLWKRLINTAFFAPAYLLMLLVSLKLIDGFMAAVYTSGSARPGLADALAGTPDTYGVVLTFIVAIMFLIISLQAAQKFGIAGADKVIGFSKQGMGAVSAGLAARAGRATIGRIGNYVSEKEGLKDAASRRGPMGWAARRALKGSRVVADSSFDARNTSAGKSLGVGEGRKGGYQTQLKEIKKKEVEYAKSLGEVDDDDEQVSDYKKLWEGAQVENRAERERLRRELREIKGDDDSGKKARIEKQKEIDALQTSEDEARQRYEREKLRRQIGGASQIDAEKTVTEAKKSMDDNAAVFNAELPELQKQFIAATTESERDMLKMRIDSIRTQMDEEKKAYQTAYKKASKSGGYASVIQDQGKIKSWITGRLAVQNYEAGKNVRKEFEKKIKKSKEDARNDSLIDAVKSSGDKGGH